MKSYHLYSEMIIVKHRLGFISKEEMEKQLREYWQKVFGDKEEILEIRKPIAWACRVCNKIDWADIKESLSKPNHIPYRGVDIGECKGKMIPLYKD